MKPIELNELLELLGYSDLRAVRSWCNKNNILIIKQGKSEFVFETEFILAYEQPFINKLKQRFGNNWEQVYQLFKDGNIPALNTLGHCTTVPIPIYTKNSESKTKLLNKLKLYEKKNAA